MKLILSVLLVCAFATEAAAQRVALPGLKPGRTVWITLADGSAVAGRVAALSSSTVDIARDGKTTTVTATDIRRIEIPDPITDGIGKGLSIGTAAGVSAAWIAFGRCVNHPQPEDGVLGCAPQGLLRSFQWGALGALGGVLVGAIVDDQHKSREIAFERPSPVAIAPILSPHAAGLGAIIRW